MRALLAFLLLCVPASVSAKGLRCGSYDAFVKHLAEKFGEVPVSTGVGDTGMVVMRVFASPDGKTFTALMVDTTGRACLLFTGVNWEPGTLVVSGEDT